MHCGSGASSLRPVSFLGRPLPAGLVSYMNDPNVDSRPLYRNFILLLLLIAVALVVHNVFSQNGYLASRRQRRELQSLQQQIRQLRNENEELDKENRALKTDPQAVERIAREQMGLVKPGEKIYTVPGRRPAGSQLPPSQEAVPGP
jgi:cell division protein FtsB